MTGELPGDAARGPVPDRGFPYTTDHSPGTAAERGRLRWGHGDYAYLREVEESGEPLVITDRGRPVARVEPYRPAQETLDRLRGCVVRDDDSTEPVAVDA
jgi:prevent-host-death family protein